MIDDWGLHWFRRDLRVPGNKALKENWKQVQGRTLGIFCFDSKFLARPDFSSNRFAFFLETLKALKADLTEQGGDLLVVDCLPHEAFPKLFHYCRSKNIPLPKIVTWNRDYEPFARERDATIKKVLKDEGVNSSDFRDHLIFEPHEILKSAKQGDFYQVYSPFSRKWFDNLASSEGVKRIKDQATAKDYFAKKNRTSDLFKIKWIEIAKNRDFPFVDSLVRFSDLNSKNVTIEIPKAGFFAAYEQLLAFKKRLDAYKDKRDIPSVGGTSKLSIFLKNGSLSSAQVIDALSLDGRNWKAAGGKNQFTKEIAWREFYYSILYHKPQVEKHSFNPKFEHLKWENNKNHFERWKEGATGFPIVDAGMRQLLKTGWMHNRVRMIVASFLTKHLLIDWRWGENHFMKELLDGDLAPNNGGWQWAASTGCDPQPYFRVFNPWLQGAKFDPEGIYVKTFVSELKDAPPEVIHDADSDRSKWNYPRPIVDHSIQRDKAIRLYKS